MEIEQIWNTAEPLTFDYTTHRAPAFRFPAHSHNAYELIFYIRGDVTYLIEDRKYELRECDLVITWPAEHHYLRVNSDADYERYDLLIAPDHPLTRLLQAIPREVEVINCRNNGVIAENFKRLAEYSKRFPKDIFHELLSALLTEILYNVQTLKKDLYIAPQKVSPLIQKALTYINAHLFTIQNISEVSDELFIAQNYFFRLFKETLKISPKKYINNKRLLFAQQLIAGGEKPTAVYLKCGFSNYVSFYKRYVEFFGHNPSAERVYQN